MSANDLSESEAREILARAKFMEEDDMRWETSPTLSTHKVFTSPLVDEQGITIRGLTVELAFRTPPSFEDCKYTFTIFQFDPRGRRRAYQLEVIPLEDFGHKDGKVRLFGPHEHIGQTAREVRVGNLDCRHHEKWFREFLARAGIGYGGRYFGPFEGGLFG